MKGKFTFDSIKNNVLTACQAINEVIDTFKQLYVVIPVLKTTLL